MKTACANVLTIVFTAILYVAPLVGLTLAAGIPVSWPRVAQTLAVDAGLAAIAWVIASGFSRSARPTALPFGGAMAVMAAADTALLFGQSGIGIPVGLMVVLGVVGFCAGAAASKVTEKLVARA